MLRHATVRCLATVTNGVKGGSIYSPRQRLTEQTVKLLASVKLDTSALYLLKQMTTFAPQKPITDKRLRTSAQNRRVVFVLGGPGSGKGTQCENLTREFDLVHLSAGELLREHIKSGSPEGNMIQDLINEGKIVPSEVTVQLLDKAMSESGREQFLIDGFPRNIENQQSFVDYMKMDCEFVLFFDCSEEVLEQRLLARNQGRSDDNIETIRKRFNTMEVVNCYAAKNMIKRVDAGLPIAQVYEQAKGHFLTFKKLPVTIS